MDPKNKFGDVKIDLNPLYHLKIDNFSFNYYSYNLVVLDLFYTIEIG